MSETSLCSCSPKHARCIIVLPKRLPILTPAKCLHYSSFHTTALIPGEYNPTVTPAQFHTVPAETRLRISRVLIRRGSACTFHTMIKTPRQPHFGGGGGLTEVMNITSWKRAIPVCNVCTHSHWIVNNKNGYAWHERRCSTSSSPHLSPFFSPTAIWIDHKEKLQNDSLSKADVNLDDRAWRVMIISWQTGTFTCILNTTQSVRQILTILPRSKLFQI